ncbi:hypothetical protein [Streptomyces sp. NPDC093600]|uniref:hypothetical protein n=1 Tax=Streptomyces sp. NPDC093600 TaxID=3366047 RepID=UPI003804FF21
MVPHEEPDAPRRDPRLVHYSDIVEQGGLQPALVSSARTHDLDLGAAETDPVSQKHHWSTAEFPSSRGAMRVHLGHGARRFAITLDSHHGHVWASGSTEDLGRAAEAMAFWRQGATLGELHERFPFMEFDRLSQAYEEGNPVETQWGLLIEDDVFLSYRELLSMLRANGKLGRLFPFFSHWVLRLALDCYDSQAGELLIKPTPEGGYAVWSSEAPESKRDCNSLEEVVEAAEAKMEEFTA